MLIVAYAPTAAAQEPPKNLTPEAEGRDDPDQGEIYAPAPTGLRGTSSTATSVSLSWSSVTNAYRYKLERSTTRSGPWTVVSQYISGTSRTAYSLTCNTTYYFKVSTRGNGSPYSTTFGSASSSVSRTTTGCPDAPAPTGLRVTSSTDARVSLRWYSVTDAYRYKLERSTTRSGPWTVVNQYISGTTHTVYSLDCNTTYYFRVSTRGNGSPYSDTFGSASSSVSRTTSGCPDAPAPTGLRVTSSTANSVSLRWYSVPDAYRYKLERSTSSSGPWTDVGSETSSTSRTATGLDCNVTYYFRVSTRGNGSPYSDTFGSASSSVSRTTSGCPDAPAPTGLRVTSSTANSVSLRWYSVPDAYRYKLERSTSSSGPWTDVGSETSGTSRSATGLDCTRPTTSG